MLRGLRWGELRAAIDLADPTRLEAPPTELRRHLKRLLLDKKYEALLEAAENAMALPCSRALPVAVRGEEGRIGPPASILRAAAAAGVSVALMLMIRPRL